MLVFSNDIEDEKLKFAVIISKTNAGEWVLCKHKNRNTYEFPGGHREEIIALMHDLYDHKFFTGNPKNEICKILNHFKLTDDLILTDVDNIVYSCLNLGYSSNFEKKKNYQSKEK